MLLVTLQRKAPLPSHFLVIFIGRLQNLCRQSHFVVELRFFPTCCLLLSFPTYYVNQNHWQPHLRFESADTANKTKDDEELREELLRSLINRRLSGPVQEILDMKPGRLPVKELPPGNVAQLYMLYLAYMKVASWETPCSKSTFYVTAKEWWPCLRFRKKSDHAMCVTCQRLKVAIHQAEELGCIGLPNHKSFLVPENKLT